MLRTILKEIYYVLTGAIVVFALLEIIWDRVILSYINLNWVLLIWLIVGILVLIIERGDERA